MFSEHRIPEVLHYDSGPQYTSAQLAEFCTSWGITHETSSPHYPQSNGFAEVCVKSMKHPLQCAKYSDTVQVCEQMDTCSYAFKTQADKHCKSLVPLYAGQPVATYDALYKIWIPAMVVCVLPKGQLPGMHQ